MKPLFVVIAFFCFISVTRSQTGIIYNDLIDGKSVLESDGSITSFAINPTGLYFTKSVGNSVVESRKTSHPDLDSLDIITDVIKINSHEYLAHAYDLALENWLLIRYNSLTHSAKIFKMGVYPVNGIPYVNINYSQTNRVVFANINGDLYQSILALDSNFNVLWNKMFPNSFGINEAGWGNNLFLEDSCLASFYNSGMDFQFVKIDFSGNIIYNKIVFNTPAPTWLCPPYKCSNGNYLFTGSNGSKSFICKCDPLGNVIFIKSVDMMDRPIWYSYIGKEAFELPNKHILLFAATDYGQKNHHIIELDSLGNLIKAYHLANEWESDFIFQFQSNGISLLNDGVRGNGIDLEDAYIHNPRFYTFTSPLSEEFRSCLNDTISTIVVDSLAYDNGGMPSIYNGDIPMYDTVFVANFSIIETLNIENCIPGFASITKENPADEIPIFPNPNNGEFTIQFPEPMQCKIYLMDELGNLILERENAFENSMKISLNTQPKGIYFVSVVSGNTRSVSRIVVE